MITAAKKLPMTLTVVLSFAMVSACASLSPTLIEQGIVQIDIKESNPVRITQVTVKREDGMMVVRGEAAFPVWYWFGNFTGHIAIDVVSPGSDAIKKRNLSLIRKRIPKKRGRKAFFVSNFAFDPPKGTVIHVAYHNRSLKTHE